MAAAAWMLGGTVTLSEFFSVRAIFGGLLVLLVLFGLYALFWSWGQLDGWAVLFASLVPYVLGGYVTGRFAHRNQVINASIVGLLFGLLLWLVLWLGEPEGVEVSGPSVHLVGIGGAIFAVIACGAGGVLSVLFAVRKNGSS